MSGVTTAKTVHDARLSSVVDQQINASKTELSKRHHEYSDAFAQARMLDSSLGADSPDKSPDQAPTLFDPVAEAKIKRSLGEYQRISANIVTQESDYAHIHGIDREAHSPDVIWTCIMLGLLIFAEGAVNAGFFVSAHMSASPFAALLLCLMISMVNILVSAVGGFYCGRRLAFGRSAVDPDLPEFKRVRRAGQYGLVAYLIAVAFFHLTVGLIRAQESLVIEHSVNAYLSLLESPEAIFLILIGVCLSVMSYHKGYSGFGDYIGYGRFARSKAKVDDLITELYEEAMDDIEDRYEALLDECLDAHEAADEKYRLRNEKVKEAEILHSALTAAVKRETIALKHLQRKLSGEAKQQVGHAIVELSGYVEDFPLEYRAPPERGDGREALDHARTLALDRLARLFGKDSETEIDTPKLNPQSIH